MVASSGWRQSDRWIVARPYGTTAEVRADVRRAMDLCKGKAALVFFVSNTMNPDVPLENILACWEGDARAPGDS